MFDEIRHSNSIELFFFGGEGGLYRAGVRVRACVFVCVSVCVSACERVCVHACIYGCASEWVGSVVVLVIVVYCLRVLFKSFSQCSSSVTLITHWAMPTPTSGCVFLGLMSVYVFLLFVCLSMCVYRH